MLATRPKTMQILMRLGLTPAQARVYLSLVRLTTASAATISKASKTSRPDVYRITHRLHEQGLVEKIIGYPSMFKAVPLKDTLRILMERRNAESMGLQTEIATINDLPKNNPNDTLLNLKSEFVLVPEREAQFPKVSNLIENAQKTIDCVFPLNVLVEAESVFAKDMIRAKDRGVKSRLITDKPENSETLKLVEYLHAETRFVSKPPRVALSIFDRKQVMMFTSPLLHLAKSAVLWSCNPSQLELAQNYFEMMWLNARKRYLKNTN